MAANRGASHSHVTFFILAILHSGEALLSILGRFGYTQPIPRSRVLHLLNAEYIRNMCIYNYPTICIMQTFIPDSKPHAESILKILINLNPKPEFSPQLSLLKIWNCIAYLNPGLHPDEVGSQDGGWPEIYLPYANEVWARYDKNEIDDDALYPADAQWAGLCDQLTVLTSEETERRQQLRLTMASEPLSAHILDQIDTREAMGRISVFFITRRDGTPYEQWCGRWFESFDKAERYRLEWAESLYEESIGS